MIHPGFLKLLRESSETFLLNFLPTLPDAQLLVAYHNFFPPNCDCVWEILPCPMHTQWQDWRDDGYSAKEIAHAWYRLKRERYDEETVEAFFEHSQRSQCDCTIGDRAVPCRHVLEQEFVLSPDCQAIIIERLGLDEYQDRRQTPCLPLVTGDVDAQVACMAERVADGCSPFKVGDQFGRVRQNMTATAHHGPNGQSSGPGGLSLAGAWHFDRGTKA
jgi:hypothetical protein